METPGRKYLDPFMPSYARRGWHNQSTARLPDYDHLNFLTFKSDVGFIDSHCHLDILFNSQNHFGTYSDYMLRNKDTYPVSYEGCVTVFCDPRHFHRRHMWQRYLQEEGVWGAFGCHPKKANLYSDLFESHLLKALLHPKVRALGEIGLDYSDRSFCSRETQHSVFSCQLRIAMTKKLPLVIHCRDVDVYANDAHKDCMNVMKRIVPRDHPIHLHCFTASWEWAERWLAEFPRLCIGITNRLTRNDADLTHEVARKIPLNRLLLETDAPYFVPRASPSSTKYSHPGMAIHVAAQIAAIRDLPLGEILHTTRQNTREVYGI